MGMEFQLQKMKKFLRRRCRLPTLNALDATELDT